MLHQQIPLTDVSEDEARVLSSVQDWLLSEAVPVLLVVVWGVARLPATWRQRVIC